MRATELPADARHQRQFVSTLAGNNRRRREQHTCRLQETLHFLPRLGAVYAPGAL